jgi:hypothetical protein
LLAEGTCDFVPTTGKRLKGKKKMLLDEKGFCKKRFVLKDCFKNKNRNKDKPSEGLGSHMKVLRKF